MLGKNLIRMSHTSSCVQFTILVLVLFIRGLSLLRLIFVFIEIFSER